VTLNDQSQLALVKLPATARQLRKPHKRANELDGQTWTKYSISIWSDINWVDIMIVSSPLLHLSLTSV
jgi:hypothetical protein